ncbi:MAG: hypothetical protein AAFQ42_00800 [Pseudomonadota bacterium]
MRVVFVRGVAAAFAAVLGFSGSAFSDARAQSATGGSATQAASSTPACGQCATLRAEKKRIAARVIRLRALRKARGDAELQLVAQRKKRLDTLLDLQKQYSDLQQDELLLARRGEANAQTVRAKFIARREKISAQEFELRADLTTLTTSIAQARAETRKAERALGDASREHTQLISAISDCESRCLIADAPGLLVPTASSLSDLAQSNRAAIRQAARETTACRSCRRLEAQISTVEERIAERTQEQTGLTARFTRLDQQRIAIRNQWRDLYDDYADRLLARLAESNRESADGGPDQRLDQIARQIVAVNGRWQRLLTREGELQDEIMRAGRARDELFAERRRLRAALGACEELCLTGESDPANAGLRLASARLNLADATADCPRCSRLADLVNAVLAEIKTAQTEAARLQQQFAQIDPQLERVRQERASIIRYAGELAELMDEFRRSGDVARAKQELAQLSDRSQRLSADIIRILDRRAQISRSVDANAETISRLSILARQRRRELDACEARCKAAIADGTVTEERPDLTFAQPARTTTRCARCAIRARLIDQYALLRQTRQAGLVLAERRFALADARLQAVSTAIDANAAAIRAARRNRDRAQAERRTLIEGLQAEATVIRRQRNELRRTQTAARQRRDAQRAGVEEISRLLTGAREGLARCETSCRRAPQTASETLSRATALIARVDDAPTSCEKCSTLRAAMRAQAGTARTAVTALTTANQRAENAAPAATDRADAITQNREAVLAGVRRWFDIDDAERRAARARAIRGDLADTTRLVTALERAGNRFTQAADTRDAANVTLTQALSSLSDAIDADARCADTCSADTDELPPFNIAEFEEQNPERLIAQPATVTPVRARCSECAGKADAITELLRERAQATAKRTTSRNIRRASAALIRRIETAQTDVRSRTTELTRRRFDARTSAERTRLSDDIRTLARRQSALDRARTAAERRATTAERDADAARQDLRRLSREIREARTVLAECNATCRVADAGEAADDKPAKPAPDDVAKGATGDKGTGKTADRLADADGVEKPAKVSRPKACDRCAVFSQRIAVLEGNAEKTRGERDAAIATRRTIIAQVRAALAASKDATALVREQRRLTRRIEARAATLERIEARIARVRTSLERCERVCRDPNATDTPAVATTTPGATPSTRPDAADGDIDVADADADDASRPTRRGTSRKRRGAPRVASRRGKRTITAPTRKRSADSGDPQVLGTVDRPLVGAWQTEVDVEVGRGRIWLPETASITVDRATRARSLPTATFAATLHARRDAGDGSADVAWGSLEITRTDDRTPEDGTGYERVAGSIGFGREVAGCVVGAARCAGGVKAGVEHVSLEGAASFGGARETVALDNTSVLLGLWGELAFPLIASPSGPGRGLSLIMKGDVHAKLGTAKADTSAISGAGTRSVVIDETVAGFGASGAAELAWDLGTTTIALGASGALDTVPTFERDGTSFDLDTDVAPSATIYLRGRIRF